MANRTILVKDKDILEEKLIETGLSYRQLAKKIGISQTTISLLIKGERNPSPDSAKKICNALNCQFNDIFFISNDYKSNQTFWINK